jgi:hypothetical protein
MLIDEDCPLVRLQLPLTWSQFLSGSELHEALSDLLIASLCELQELHRDQSNEQLLLA